MEILAMPRASGKTTRLIEWAARSPRRIIVVANESSVRQLKQVVPFLVGQDSGVEDRIISFNRISHFFDGRSFENWEVSIDDLERIIPQIFRCYNANLCYVTMTTLEESHHAGRSW